MARKDTTSRKAANEAEFSQFFWTARKEQAGLSKSTTTNNAAHNAALSFAKGHGWEWAEKLLEASRLDRARAYDQALEQLRECEPSIPARWRSLVDFVRGTVLSGKGEHDEAVKAYRNALDDPKFDTPGKAWNNLGNSLSKKGEHDEAITAYRKALDDPKYDTPGKAWTGIGIVLAGKGEHDEAITAYRNALDDPKYDTPGYAWNNLGNALSKKGEHDEAITAYRKALDDPKYDTPAKVWTNLAQALAKLGNQGEAEKAFNEALNSADPQGSDHARARLGLRLLKAKIEPKALSPDDLALVAKPPAGAETDQIEDGIVAAIRAAGDTQYDKYLKERKDSNRDDTLSILRGWSSAVTLLEGSPRRWRGGGYFLKWKGYGIVIDPGFDFLRNFHDAGYHGREIDAVIVSHHHSDHNADLKAIDDLCYELYNRRATVNGSRSKPYVLLWDEDTAKATKFDSEMPQHRHQAVVMGSGFPQPFNLSDHPAKIPLRVRPFKVNHGSDVPHAMGMVVELLDETSNAVLRIGYTADTGYFSELHGHLTGCDIVIAHISQPSIDELQDATKLKAVHLGYRGTAKLLSECKPKLALIGEFWAGFADLRIHLVKGLRERSGVKEILPAGIGMHIKLPSLEIECTECHKYTPFTQVKIAPPTDNFGSQSYLCPGCMIG